MRFKVNDKFSFCLQKLEDLNKIKELFLNVLFWTTIYRLKNKTGHMINIFFIDPLFFSIIRWNILIKMWQEIPNRTESLTSDWKIQNRKSSSGCIAASLAH